MLDAFRYQVVVSSILFFNICVHILLFFLKRGTGCGVLDAFRYQVALFICPHTDVDVSSYRYMCVPILLLYTDTLIYYTHTNTRTHTHRRTHTARSRAESGWRSSPGPPLTVIYIGRHSHTHTHTHTHTCMCTCMYVCVYIYTFIHTFIHTGASYTYRRKSHRKRAV